MKGQFILEISQEIYRIFNLYYKLHGVRITLFSQDGQKLYPREDQPDCEYCRLIRQELGKEDLCCKLDRKMIDIAIKENRMISYRCHGGLQEAALPLIVEGKPAGCIMLGQFRKEWIGEDGIPHGDHSPYLEAWEGSFHDERLAWAYNKTPAYREDKVPVLLELYQVIMDFISRERMIRHRDYDLILPVLEMLEEDPSAQISLQEASELIGRSPSSVSRLFRNITGTSFQNWQIQFKLDRAEQMMQNRKHRPLSEIAWELGYQDPLYFSRLFKKHRGLSPKAWKTKNITEV